MEELFGSDEEGEDPTTTGNAGEGGDATMTDLFGSDDEGGGAKGEEDGQTVMADLFGSDSDEEGEEGGEKDPLAEEGDGEERRPKGEPLALALPRLPQFKQGTKLVRRPPSFFPQLFCCGRVSLTVAVGVTRSR